MARPSGGRSRGQAPQSQALDLLNFLQEMSCDRVFVRLLQAHNNKGES